MSEKSAVEQLAEIEALEALEAKAKATPDARELAAMAELEKRKIVAGLKKTHQCPMTRIDSDGGMIVVKAPEREQQERFRRAALNEATRDQANPLLNDAGLLHPSHEEFDEICRKFPAISDIVSSKIVELAGSEAKSKKV